MELVLGVDAGGTATRAVAATRAGHVVGRGAAGPGNPIAVGNHAAADALATAVGEALSGQDASLVTSAAVALAGAARLEDPTAVAVYASRWSALGLTCDMPVVPDVITAFTAATPSPDGTVLIAGTGAVAARITSWRVTRTADGHGWLLGDEGSGLWLGLTAVRRVARIWTRATFEPRALPAIVGLVAAHADAPTADALVDWAHQVPRSRIAALAPAVCASADDGDPDCRAIVAEAATRLLATLDELGSPPGPVVLAGGLLTADTAVRRALLEALARRRTPTLTGHDAAIGAAWLAARATGDPDGGRGLHAALLTPPAAPPPTSPR
ncbi:N-acetylglucosamine kinase [Phytomonospora endophytica]|uniref:N-acetylglucosamine kinase-like BadF-type ATPase n=1 Tax=Phytomonospora endophytica TaxID=714109 RepID=A0A841FHI0_9ACTN|nr:BadF/BadG/BcrA/BcrD ATPase family protein [Phytomonospora endophytica]MBB6036791.1 N-acetylglucosamine kinase-like BadF-type ATPase [Phytomonospora endophytica]GIG68175.1 N-acetylglucosamine kinase [Phytomonospora endophytica]